MNSLQIINQISKMLITNKLSIFLFLIILCFFPFVSRAANTANLQSFMIENIYEKCTFFQDRGAYQSVNDSARSRDISVQSLTAGEDGWIALSFASRGQIYLSYYNYKHEKFVCGRQTLKQAGIKFTRSNNQEVILAEANSLLSKGRKSYLNEQDTESHSEIANETDGSGNIKLSMSSEEFSRQVVMNWSGRGDLISFVVLINNESGDGTFNIQISDGSINCSGFLDLLDIPEGKWSMSCNDGAVASGEFQTLGKGKGARGSGKDSKGNSISFRVLGH